MSYPVIAKSSPFGGICYKEMTPEEYEKELQWFRDYESSDCRIDQEYSRYLARWFSNESCDGWPDFKTRYKLHKLPMSLNVYAMG